MGKKLPSHGPNILKHLQKNFGAYKGRWIYALLVFLLLRESRSPFFAAAFSRCYREWIALWSCLNPGKGLDSSTNGFIMSRRQTRLNTARAIKVQRRPPRRGHEHDD